MAALCGFSTCAERPWKGISHIVLDAAAAVVEPWRVRLPYCESDGSFRYHACFDVSARKWYEPRPSEVGGLVPMGLETLPSTPVEASALMISEGESDCLALREAFVEWSVFPGGVFSVALPGAGSWQRGWARFFWAFDTIFVLPDGDAAGDRMARTVRRNLPWSRLVMLPDGEDARSIVQRRGGAGVLPYLNDADRRWRLDAAIRQGESLTDVRSRFGMVEP